MLHFWLAVLQGVDLNEPDHIGIIIATVIAVLCAELPIVYLLIRKLTPVLSDLRISTASLAAQPAPADPDVFARAIAMENAKNLAPLTTLWQNTFDLLKDEIQRVTDERDSFKTRLIALETTVNVQAGQIQKLTDDKDNRFTLLSDSIADLRTSVADKEATIKALRLDLETANHKLLTLQAKIDELGGAVEAALKKNDELKTELERVKEERDSLKTENDRLHGVEAERDALKALLVKAEAELVVLRALQPPAVAPSPDASASAPEGTGV